MSSLTQLVLRTTELEPLREFYETLLDVSFTPEQHGDGPRHYSYQLGEVLFELYPTKQRKNTAQKVIKDRLGFSIESVDSLCHRIDEKYIQRWMYETENGRAIELSDPDGRTIYVEEKRK